MVSSRRLAEVWPRRASPVVLYSRDVYGYSDLGANQRRPRSWLAAIGEPAERLPR